MEQERHISLPGLAEARPRAGRDLRATGHSLLIQTINKST